MVQTPQQKGMAPVGLNIGVAASLIMRPGSNVRPIPKPVIPRAAPTQREPESGSSMWLAKDHAVPPDRMNGWVVAWNFESYVKEDLVATVY